MDFMTARGTARIYNYQHYMKRGDNYDESPVKKSSSSNQIMSVTTLREWINVLKL